MRGDRVGVPRRAITHIESAQRPRPIFIWASAEDDEASPKRTADPWHTGRV
jgi:hypothetical protein